MKLCYRGVDYKIAQAVLSQPLSSTSSTLIYRGNPYQSKHSQLMTYGIESQRSITNQLPFSSRKTTIVSLRLIYRGVDYIF